MTDEKKPIALEAYEKLAEAFSKLAPSKAENAYIEQPAMRKAVGDVRGLKIFEAGCGPGILAEYLIHEGAKVVAFDVSPKMIELAKERNPKNATFLPMELFLFHWQRNTMASLIWSLLRWLLIISKTGQFLLLSFIVC